MVCLQYLVYLQYLVVFSSRIYLCDVDRRTNLGSGAREFSSWQGVTTTVKQVFNAPLIQISIGWWKRKKWDIFNLVPTYFHLMRILYHFSTFCNRVGLSWRNSILRWVKCKCGYNYKGIFEWRRAQNPFLS